MNGTARGGGGSGGGGGGGVGVGGGGDSFSGGVGFCKWLAGVETVLTLCVLCVLLCYFHCEVVCMSPSHRECFRRP